MKGSEKMASTATALLSFNWAFWHSSNQNFISSSDQELALLLAFLERVPFLPPARVKYGFPYHAKSDSFLQFIFSHEKINTMATEKERKVLNC